MAPVVRNHTARCAVAQGCGAFVVGRSRPQFTALAVVGAVTTGVTAVPVAAAAQTVGPATQLAELEVAVEAPDGYDRAAWGSWDAGEISGDSCNTRCELLAVNIEPDGSWTSAFGTFRSASSSDFDIDHVVSIAEVHRSGGTGWSDAERRDFYNWAPNLVVRSLRRLGA